MGICGARDKLKTIGGAPLETHNWCQKFSLPLELSGLKSFSEAQRQSSKFLTHQDYQVLGKNSKYWDWFTRDMTNTSGIELLTYLEERHKLPVNTPKTRMALWEYGEGDVLPPHIDLGISLSSAIIVSLEGRFETYLHESKESGEILDTVTYGPGEYIVLNNTVYYHGGRPLDPYRLALVAFVDPSFDMTHFWS